MRRAELRRVSRLTLTAGTLPLAVVLGAGAACAHPATAVPPPAHPTAAHQQASAGGGPVARSVVGNELALAGQGSGGRPGRGPLASLDVALPPGASTAQADPVRTFCQTLPVDLPRCTNTVVSAGTGAAIGAAIGAGLTVPLALVGGVVGAGFGLAVGIPFLPIGMVVGPLAGAAVGAAVLAAPAAVLGGALGAGIGALVGIEIPIPPTPVPTAKRVGRTAIPASGGPDDQRQ